MYIHVPIKVLVISKASLDEVCVHATRHLFLVITPTVVEVF